MDVLSVSGCSCPSLEQQEWCSGVFTELSQGQESSSVSLIWYFSWQCQVTLVPDKPSKINCKNFFCIESLYCLKEITTFWAVCHTAEISCCVQRQKMQLYLALSTMLSKVMLLSMFYWSPVWASVVPKGKYTTGTTSFFHLQSTSGADVWGSWVELPQAPSRALCSSAPELMGHGLCERKDHSVGVPSNSWPFFLRCHVQSMDAEKNNSCIS